MEQEIIDHMMVPQVNAFWLKRLWTDSLLRGGTIEDYSSEVMSKQDYSCQESIEQAVIIIQKCPSTHGQYFFPKPWITSYVLSGCYLHDS